MATKFKQNQVVQLPTTVPKGPVLKLRMLDDGTVECLVRWQDDKGMSQERWFREDDLQAALD